MNSIYIYKSVPNADKGIPGRGMKISEIFVDIINGRSPSAILVCPESECIH